MVIGPESYGISLETVEKQISVFDWGFFNVEFLEHILVIKGAEKVLSYTLLQITGHLQSDYS